MKFDGQTVVITGGTSGIGIELVRQLANKCHEVIVLARNQQVLNSLASDYPNVFCYICNIANKNALEVAVDSILKRHPRVSIVINNAAIQNSPTFFDDDFNFDGIAQEVTVNLMAPMWIVALFLGHFIASEKPSAFVNVTSGLAIYPKTTSAVYCATKAGLRSFSKSLRYQLEGTRISVFEAIMPIVDTPMTRGRKNKKKSANKAAAALIEGVEKNRLENFIGLSALIPIIARFSPKLMANILRRG